MQRRLLLTVMGGALLVAGSQLQASSLKTSQDKLSYAMGAELGKGFKTHKVSVNTKLFSQGMQDALSGKKAQLTDKQIQQTLAKFQQQQMAKMEAAMKKVAATSAKVSAAFLQANKKKAGVKTLAGGLQYKIITAGKGASPTKGDKVTVDYEGKLISGKVFDSSYKRGKPATFAVNAVIPGWSEALQKMKPGAIWELYIPSSLAYGAQGMGGVIPGNSALIFKVHLISVKAVPAKAAPAAKK